MGVQLLLVANHRPFQDPRVEWQAGGSDDDWICLGLHEGELTVGKSGRVVEVSAPRFCPVAPGIDSDIYAELVAIRRLSNAEVAARYDTAHPDRLRGLIDHFVRSAEVLTELGSGLSRADTVIAADLDSLLPGLILKRRFGQS